VVVNTNQYLPPNVRWLLVGTIALFIISVAMLMRTIQLPKHYQRFYRRGSLVTVISGVVIALLGFLDLGTTPILCIVIFIMMINVINGIYVWIKHLGAEEIEI